MVIIINYPPPTEGLHHVEPNVTAYFQNTRIGKGTLYIAESVFCWIANSGEGFSLKYQDIFIHAVSRDLSNFPEECLYLMINGNINLSPEGEHQDIASALNNLSVEENEDANEDEEERTSEMRFVPDNLNMLDVMFQALSDCQALNPDQEERSDDDDDAIIAPSFTIHEGNGFIDEDYGAGGDQAGYVEEEMNEEQFEDAEQ